MARIAIIGDGPGGLSAALFLARAGHDTSVFGTDGTAMHYAHLNNYLGSPDTGGTAFQRAAVSQVEGAGAVIVRTRVTALTPGNRFRLTLENGDTIEADYVILSEGKSPEIGITIGAALGANGAIAGDGAVAALDILAREAGRDVQDWDKAEG